MALHLNINSLSLYVKDNLNLDSLHLNELKTPWVVISPVSEFFSFGNLMDTFWFFKKERIYTVINLQELVRNHTPYFAHISKSNFFMDLKESLVINHFNISPHLSLNTVRYSDLYWIIDSYVEDLWQITKLFNDADKLELIFPHLYVEIGIFDAGSIDIDGTMYAHLSNSTTKIFYPEPFIASPSFIHEDLWFIHVLHYQHWLWFMFISLIMFYFITFINVVRWCTPHNTQKHKILRISRSKCVDLMTACVPLSWSTLIIMSESPDLTDHYNGLSTGEILTGIKGYRWGWEYFYPQSTDLNYDVSSSPLTTTRKPPMYDNNSLETLELKSFLKYYQNKKYNKFDSDNSTTINFMNFDSYRSPSHNSIKDFRKIQYFSQVNHKLLYKSAEDYKSRYQKLNTLYLNKPNLFDNPNYSSLSIIKVNFDTSLKLTSFELNSIEQKPFLIKPILYYEKSVNKSEHFKFKFYNYMCLTNNLISIIKTLDIFNEFTGYFKSSPLQTLDILLINLLPSVFNTPNKINECWNDREIDYYQKFMKISALNNADKNLYMVPWSTLGTSFLLPRWERTIDSSVINNRPSNNQLVANPAVNNFSVNNPFLQNASKYNETIQNHNQNTKPNWYSYLSKLITSFKNSFNYFNQKPTNGQPIPDSSTVKRCVNNPFMYQAYKYNESIQNYNQNPKPSWYSYLIKITKQFF